MRIIRTNLVRIVRFGGASIRVAAWLLFTFVMLALFTLGMAFILMRLAYNAPMIAWRAANDNQAPRP